MRSVTHFMYSIALFNWRIFLMAKESKESIENQPDSTESSQAFESIPLAVAGVAEQDVLSELIVQESTEQALSNERRHIAKSATLVMLGNLGSSIMGMVRQIVVVAFGASIAGPFNAALLPARTFNDLLINGSVGGALIPTFNDYAAPEKRDELRRIVFTLINLLILVTFTLPYFTCSSRPISSIYWCL